MNLQSVGNRKLPIWDVEKLFATALATHQVVIVSAETGSGKTTQLPQMLLQGGFTDTGKMIGISQPRRIAASANARRIAEELGVQIGQEVGFQVRFNDQVGPMTKVKAATEGIFLQEVKSDQIFDKYSALVLDEFHERSENVDVLLGLAKLALDKRPNFRVVISSATIETDGLIKLFGRDSATVIKCEGRTFPVEHIFEDKNPEFSFTRGYGEETFEMPEFVAEKAANLIAEGEKGDILVFLFGYADLERAKKYFDGQGTSARAYLAYGEMQLEDLEALLHPNGHQRVIFATNVAETSLTFPGITTVINSGKVKKDFFNPRTGITSIDEVNTSQASDLQRAGRAGRLGPGRCFHCFTEDDFESHRKYDIPAIQRTDLSHSLMLMASVGIRDFESFPFLTSPEPGQISAARKVLVDLDALNEDNSLTEYGEKLSRFPLTPSQAHLLLAAAEENVVNEMATFLAMQQARPIPRNSKRETPGYESIIRDCKSDPAVYLTLWNAYYKAQCNWRWAKDQGLTWQRMQEARDVRGQLLDIAEEQKLPIGKMEEGGLGKLKRALLKAYPSQICASSGMHDYDSLSGKWRNVYIHPGSSMFSPYAPRLIWFMSVQQTGKLYGQTAIEVTISELREIFPDKVRLIRKCYPDNESKEVRISEDCIFEGGRCLSNRDIETRPMNAEEVVIWGILKQKTKYMGSFPVDVYEQYLEEGRTAFAAADRRMMELLQAQELDNKRRERERQEATEAFARLEQKAQAILETMPKIPEDAPGHIRLRAREIRISLESMFMTHESVNRVPEQIESLRRQLEAHRKTTDEYQEKLELIQLVFDDEVKKHFGACPICASPTIKSEGKCECVRTMTHSDLKLNGDSQTNLVTIKADTGEILARIYIDHPEGAYKVVRSEINRPTKAYDDLAVIER